VTGRQQTTNKYAVGENGSDGKQQIADGFETHSALVLGHGKRPSRGLGGS